MSRWISMVGAVLVTLPVLAACVESEAELGSETQESIACPKWGCGENSPIMGPFGFHELDTAGTANAEGVRVLGLKLGSVTYQPRIINGSQLIGFDPIGGGTISGTQLTNAYLSVWGPDGPYKITIKKVTPQASSFTKFWIGPATQIETYELLYNKVNSTDPLPLCNNPPERTSGEGSGRVWARPLEAILYTGDRYDADRKLVTASSYRGSGTWFNIACAGSALAKLHLTRHTTAGTVAGFVSSAAQRQSMLKMYVSDLCGRGVAFTKKGTPLHWENTPGWSLLDGAELAHESMWTSSGALCLDTHRRFDEYLADIHAECTAAGHPLPPCDGESAPPGSYYLTTAVPIAPVP